MIRYFFTCKYIFRVFVHFLISNNDIAVATPLNEIIPVYL